MPHPRLSVGPIARRGRRRRRGANAIEFALLMPVFLGLLTGIMDYSWFFLLRTVAAEAVHEGARTGAVTMKKNDPAAAAVATAKARLASTTSSVKPKITATLGGTAPDGYVTVTITFTVEPLVGLLPTPTTISATSVMRLEDQS